jgi:hypothetical protein
MLFIDADVRANPCNKITHSDFVAWACNPDPNSSTLRTAIGFIFLARSKKLRINLTKIYSLLFVKLENQRTFVNDTCSLTFAADSGAQRAPQIA